VIEGVEEREEERDGGEKRRERKGDGRSVRVQRATEEAKVRGCIGNRLARGWKAFCGFCELCGE